MIWGGRGRIAPAMAVRSLSIFPFVVVALLFGVAALLVLRRSLFPRPRGSEPHCRKCDYLLVNLTSTKCPECGVALTEDNVVHGRRARRPGLAAFGFLLLLVALAS